MPPRKRSPYDRQVLGVRVHVPPAHPGGLYPTKIRLELLRAVEAGDVLDGILDDEPTIWLVRHPDPPFMVTARVDELVKAGWVELPDPPVEYRLTDVGRQVLAEHGGGP